MLGVNSKTCEKDCQCSGLITNNFKINSGSGATKHKREEATVNNFKLKMLPHSLSFNNSPLTSPISQRNTKRRVLGEIQNIHSPTNLTPNYERKRSPLSNGRTPSPVHKGSEKRTNKIARVFEERSQFKILNSETADWSTTKLDFSEVFNSSSFQTEKKFDKLEVTETYVPQNEIEDQNDDDDDDETLHDLEEEFEADNFDTCTKYEIISTDSPDIISRGRTSSRKIMGRIEFGEALSENEPSTSFNRMPSVTRTLSFDEDFEFTSPAVKKQCVGNASIKKTLKFTTTPPKLQLVRDQSSTSISSINSMPSVSSPTSTRLRIFPSESTTSMESGFVSELDEPFLDLDENTSSPKMANFNDLLSGKITDSEIFMKDILMRRPPLLRSVSCNPGGKAKTSLFPINESPSTKRSLVDAIDENTEPEVSNKRKKTNSELSTPVKRPVLQRAYSENNASIMSALARSDDTDLIGDFSLPFALPVTIGNHSDLKSISCDTLAGLIHGRYSDSIKDFKVIDCRYPYEFEGGHINGAMNLYTTDQVETLMNKPLESRLTDNKRSILVFHCEFSLERGPKLSRFLRSTDRARNQENYPYLHYPEVYLLHEGYRKFYQLYPELCSPAGYTAMLDPTYKHLLRKHRSSSSSSQQQRPQSSTNAGSQHRRQRLLL